MSEQADNQPQAQEHLTLPGISNLQEIITLVKALESLQGLGPDFAALVALITQAKGLVMQLVELEKQAAALIEKDAEAFISQLPKGADPAAPAEPPAA